MRKHELTANAVFLLPIVAGLGFLLLTLWPVNFVVMVTLYVCGLVDLAYAKLPLFRRRVFNSFGPSYIPRLRRDAYFRGYKRIAFGMAVNALVLIYYSTMSAVR
jgi:hypothetical protein